MKKLTICALSVFMALSMAACTQAPAVSSDAASAPGGSSAASRPAPVPNSGKPTTVTGTLVDATMHNISIEVDGETIHFPLNQEEDALVEMPENLTVGETVTVTYEGDLNSADGAAVIVTDLKAGALDANTQTEQSITGKVLDAAMHSIMIEADGKQYMFALNAGEQTTEINVTGGLYVDVEVTIVYEGDIKGTDTTGVTVLRIENPAK